MTLSTRARKERKRRRETFVKAKKIPTGVYLLRNAPRGLGLMSPAELMMRILMRRSK